MDCGNCHYDKDIESIKKDLHDIKISLVGDEFHPEGGLIKNQRILKQRMDNIEKKVFIASGIATSIGFALGFLMNLFLKNSSHG
jgi:ElaB/YqjD/DUF883 family membrane-anchored ribosome-binding protein